MARKSKAALARSRAAKKGAATRAANKYAAEQARGFFERVLRRQPGEALRAQRRGQRQQRVVREREGRASGESLSEQLRGEDYAASWEVGTTYTKKGHSVAVNLRIGNANGRPMSKAQAIAAVRSYRNTGELSDQYTLHGIDWQQPNKAAKSGGDTDLAAFSAIFAATPLSDIRIGALNQGDA